MTDTMENLLERVDGLQKRIVTRSAVRAMVRTALERGEWKMPTNEGIQRISVLMITWQMVHFVSPVINERKKLLKEAAASLKKFVLALEKIDEHKNGFELQKNALAKYSNRTSGSLANMKNTATAWLSDPFFSVLAVTSPPLEKWRSYVPELAIAFKEAVEETNKVQVGFSADGPCSAFLSEAVKAIFGEVVTPANISGWLYEKIPQETQSAVSGARKLN